MKISYYESMSMAKTNTIKKGIQLLLYNEHDKDSSSINNNI